MAESQNSTLTETKVVRFTARQGLETDRKTDRFEIGHQ